ncbi:nuclear transport factor 2 family protein [Saccharopolyspora sp. K220]|uniref:nuclear transport factor 2 family protein n=1 Tax=Saccharopolyspora soli TaxID=2926618 RepID=UPI001F57624D|nr:nuclear transport factor 2 family protein [Saccharopolyspora soli]MCI2421993.1 nuclear transport factor 2 family protein [Saccharopolyspora soli]
MKTITLAEAPQVVRDHLKAINALDLDAIVAVFPDDAYVNDNSREIRGKEAVRAFFAKEFVGDSVSIEPVEVIEHYGDVIIRGRYDGTYDKTNLPEVLIMSNYLTIRDDQIVAEAIIFNQPSPYNESAD